jgi:hypothetical protein
MSVRAKRRPWVEGHVPPTHLPCLNVDVSLRSVSICVDDASGELQDEAEVATELDVIVATLRRLRPRRKTHYRSQ